MKVKEYSVESRPFVIIKMTDKKEKRNVVLIDAALLLVALFMWWAAIAWKNEFTHALEAAASITVLFFLFAVGNHKAEREKNG
jgi:heme/copper-type cytochrome/quinol oxidase subunit 3